MARISYQNSTFRSFYKFEIPPFKLGVRFIHFDIRFIPFGIRFSRWTFVLHKQRSFFKIDIVFT